MRIRKRFPALFFTVWLIFALGASVYAHETPDMTKTGSISVTMAYEGNAVPGGSLTLYQVGSVSEEDGDYSFTLTGKFKNSGVSLDDISSAALAERLASYVSSKSLSGKTVSVGKDGKTVAAQLPLGLYLVIQTQAADGYEAVSPFLVSVPENEDGTYIYDVDASPKVSSLTKSEQGTPSAPTGPPSSRLPQTGQLNWPAPVMAVFGLCLILFGWSLRFRYRVSEGTDTFSGKREKNYEA